MHVGSLPYWRPASVLRAELVAAAGARRRWSFILGDEMKRPKMTQEQSDERRKARHALRVAQEGQDLDDFAWMKARRELGKFLTALDAKYRPPKIAA